MVNSKIFIPEKYFEKIVSPFNKKIISGADVSGDDVYFKLQEAYKSDSDTENLGVWQRSLKSVSWDDVEKISIEILQTQSKDLWVLMLLMEFILHKKGVNEFLKSIKFMCVFLQKFGENFYPLKHEKRMNLIDWFFKKMNLYFKKNFGIGEKASEALVYINENFGNVQDLKITLDSLNILTYKFDDFFDFVNNLNDKYIKLQKNEKMMQQDNLSDDVEEIFKDENNCKAINGMTVESAYDLLEDIKDFLEKKEPRNITYLILDLIPNLKKYTVKDLIKYGSDETSPMYLLSKIICKEEKKEG